MKDSIKYYTHGYHSTVVHFKLTKYMLYLNTQLQSSNFFFVKGQKSIISKKKMRVIFEFKQNYSKNGFQSLRFYKLRSKRWVIVYLNHINSAGV